MKHIFFSIVLLLLFSCSEKEPIENSISSYRVHTENELSLNSSLILDIGTLNIIDSAFTISANGIKQIDIEIVKPTLCFLESNDLFIPFYSIPNLKTEIWIKGSEESAEYSFAEDDYMNNFTKQFHITVRSILNSPDNSPDIIEEINTSKKLCQKKLEQLKNKLSDDVYLILLGMVNGKMAHLKFILSENENLNDSYFDFAGDVKLNNDFFLTYSDNLSVTLDVIRAKYFREYGKHFKNAPNTIAFIDENIDSKALRNQILTFIVSQEIPKVSIEKKAEYIAELQSLYFPTKKLSYIDNILPNSAPGTVIGEKAMFSKTLTSFSPDFSFDKIKGKKIYVDNWATWCGPCMKSIKEFQLRKAALLKRDNCVFIFVSFDRKEEKWREYISKNFPEEKNIIHLFNGVDMKTEYGKYYNLSSLPTYFLIDKNGKMADLTPPHPTGSNFLAYFR